jgi:hypothetical protein
LTTAEQDQFKAELAKQGVLLNFTAFGSTDIPTTAGRDPIELADKIAALVKNSTVVGGVDINYEVYLYHRSFLCHTYINYPGLQRI